MANTPGTIMDVKNALGYDNAAEFRKDWGSLTESDKNDLKNGVGKGGTGTMTY